MKTKNKAKNIKTTKGMSLKKYSNMTLSQIHVISFHVVCWSNFTKITYNTYKDIINSYIIDLKLK